MASFVWVVTTYEDCGDGDGDDDDYGHGIKGIFSSNAMAQEFAQDLMNKYQKQRGESFVEQHHCVQWCDYYTTVCIDKYILDSDIKGEWSSRHSNIKG